MDVRGLQIISGFSEKEELHFLHLGVGDANFFSFSSLFSSSSSSATDSLMDVVVFRLKTFSNLEER